MSSRLFTMSARGLWVNSLYWLIGLIADCLGLSNESFVMMCLNYIFLREAVEVFKLYKDVTYLDS